MQITSQHMQDVLYQLFLKYRISHKKAFLLAQTYTESTLAGVNSHGINRVPLFLEYVENGSVKINAEAEKVESFGSIERWDGNYGPGIINATKCTHRAVELAKTHGMGLVALRNTNHWMRGDVQDVEPMQPGDTIYYPGERSAYTREENLKNGMPVSDSVWEKIMALSES